MSVSSTNTSNAYWQQLQSLHQQRRQDFSNLTQSVQQGDIAGAQQALAALQQLNGSNNSNGGNSGGDFSSALNNAISAASSPSSSSSTDPFAAVNSSQTSNGASSAGSSISSLLNTLGQDLQSGNLSQAQQDFQQLQQGLQADGTQQASGQHRHHHHHGGGEQQNDSGLQSLLNAANGSQSQSLATTGSASAANNVQQLQAALSLYQANAGSNDISSLLMSMSV
ncbi:hypothetical protein VA599_14025 [Chromobacterium sp. TRC.1.1.SA]|uniref:Uncharacterized protein n=1 Tax=Chromobacterium indicum TaxID=3110228 RepID=A0ABV0CN99_9NEIS